MYTESCQLLLSVSNGKNALQNYCCCFKAQARQETQMPQLLNCRARRFRDLVPSSPKVLSRLLVIVGDPTH